jgi:hypothetical protein
MVFENLIVLSNVVLDCHAVLRAASTYARDVNAQAVVDQFALIQKILYSFSSGRCD